MRSCACPSLKHADSIYYKLNIALLCSLCCAFGQRSELLQVRALGVSCRQVKCQRCHKGWVQRTCLKGSELEEKNEKDISIHKTLWKWWGINSKSWRGPCNVFPYMTVQNVSIHDSQQSSRRKLIFSASMHTVVLFWGELLLVYTGWWFFTL